MADRTGDPLIWKPGWKVVPLTEKSRGLVLLWPLPTEFYEVTDRLLPLANKREEMFSGREGPEAAPPSSMSSATKHCSVREEPQLLTAPQEASFWGFLLCYFPTQCSSTTRPAAESQAPANTLAKARSRFSTSVSHPRSQGAREHPAASEMQSTKLLSINLGWF